MESNRQVAIHMNSNDEPRKITPGSRASQDLAKAAEFDQDLPSLDRAMDRRGLRRRHVGREKGSDLRKRERAEERKGQI